jgi:hypothetical protein
MRHIADSHPVDGYNVEPDADGTVVIVFSNRYGEADQYRFGPEDARKIGEALCEVADEVGSGNP